MKEDSFPPITLRYHGLFDFDGLYSAVIDWAKNYGYMWHERAYKHKVPSPKGAEQEFEWEMVSNVNVYTKYKIQISIHSWELNEVEVEEAGKKKILMNGRIYMVIVSSVEFDWQKKFEGSRFLARLGELYNKLLFKDFDYYVYDTLYYRVWNLHALLKRYFDMQSKNNAYKNYIPEH
jgi:hypothetical protein